MPSPHHEPRHVRVDHRPRVGPQELDQRAVVPLRPRGEGIERRELLEELALPIRPEVPATNLVVVGGTARVHDQRALIRQGILDREMD